MRAVRMRRTVVGPTIAMEEMGEASRRAPNLIAASPARLWP